MLHGLVCERTTYTPVLQRLEQSISAQHLRLGCQSGLSEEASRSEAGFLDWMRTLECGFATVVFGLLTKRIRVIDVSPLNAHPHTPASRCIVGNSLSSSYWSLVGRALSILGYWCHSRVYIHPYVEFRWPFTPAANPRVYPIHRSYISASFLRSLLAH